MYNLLLLCNVQPVQTSSLLLHSAFSSSQIDEPRSSQQQDSCDWSEPSSGWSEGTEEGKSRKGCNRLLRSRERTRCTSPSRLLYNTLHKSNLWNRRPGCRPPLNTHQVFETGTHSTVAAPINTFMLLPGTFVTKPGQMNPALHTGYATGCEVTHTENSAVLWGDGTC